MKKVISLAISLFLITALAACGGGADGKGKPLSDHKLVVGVSAGPHEEIMGKVKEVAAKDGLEIEIKTFSDYVLPNVALAEGELDVNSFQHEPYLEQFKKDRNLDLTVLAPTLNFPLGIYSNKIKDIKQIKKGDKLGIPNDPTNNSRALRLIEQAGLIKLKEEAGVKATVKDIVENPLQLQFVELEAAQIPRHLDEVAAAAINSNFAIENKLVPTRDAILIEPKDSPWVNVLAVRTENKDDPVLKKLVKAYHSEEVKQFVMDNFDESILPSW